MPGPDPSPAPAGDAAPGPLRLVQSFASTPSADPDPLRTREEAAARLQRRS